MSVVFSDHTYLNFDVKTIVFVLCGYHKMFPVLAYIVSFL